MPADDPLSADLASLRIARDDAPPPKKVGGWIMAGALVATVSAASVVAVPYAKGRVFKTEVTTTEIGLVSPAQATIDLSATFARATSAFALATRALVRAAATRAEAAPTALFWSDGSSSKSTSPATTALPS